jgi:hypothetical protein
MATTSNPTLTSVAMAVRSAEKIIRTYFEKKSIIKMDKLFAIGNRAFHGH